MSTRFFTNTQENTLLKKFEGIFQHTNVHFFDILVGYFRASGYFRVRKFLDKVAKIRILVGINVDKLTSEAAKKGLEFNFNSEVTRAEFIRKLREDIQDAEYDKDVEEGILQFIDDVITGKLEIKAHPSKNIHAKIYIFRQEHEHSHAGYEAVITGSSNLTEAGMETNFEFNVELRDHDDIVFATETFNKLWEEGIDILPVDVEGLKKSTYLNEEFTPFEIYIKFLIEYFGKSIEYDPDSVTDLPKGYKKLAYQMDAVTEGYNKLMKHNGFILADVVGLGKTIVASLIAKKFYYSNGYKTRILVVHPPSLRSNWENTFNDFDIPNVTFCSNGSLHHIKHPENYDLIIVDEAHKFRSDDSERFHYLQKLCKTPRRRPGTDGAREKKVMLVTATPLNNKPDDIRNQLYLFQDAKRSTLEIGNLQHFFRPLIDKYEKLKKESDRAKIAREVKRIYEEIRVKVLEPLIVRRTRTDIRNTEQYWNDILEQGLTFPEIEAPRQVLYQLDHQLSSLYDRTLTILKGGPDGITYYRYQAIRFLQGEARKLYKHASQISLQLAEIMRVLLVKRIDSSFHAFKMSLSRFYRANAAMLKMLENDRIYIAPKLNVNEFIINDNEEELEQLLEEHADPAMIQVFRTEDFSEEFIRGIRQDNDILAQLVKEWEAIEYDPKLDEFEVRLVRELFDKAINDNGKLVIFSESKETTRYLEQKLKNKGFENILAIDSSNQSDYAHIIRENFDANLDIGSQKDDYKLLITTEVLAEGVNLHRANIVLNYDIPWNATRLMQRIGRVNRIGTKSKRIYIYNFFPTVQTDSEIELNKKAYMKLQAFHSALGEDSQIYSTEEEYSTFGLFERIPEEERDERLVYLNELRKFRDEQPEWFNTIKNMPKRARTGRRDKLRKNTTIAFLKNAKRDSFFYMQPDMSFEELTFLEAAKVFHANVSEKGIELHSLHHAQVEAALKAFRDETFVQALGDKTTVKLNPNDKKAIAFISDNLKQEFPADHEKAKLEVALLAVRRGKFQKLPREINTLVKTVEKERMKRIDAFKNLMVILDNYPLLQEHDDVVEVVDPKELEKREKLLPEIIISESFA